MAPSSAASTSVQVALRIRPTTSQDLNSIPSRFQRTVINAVSNTTVSVDATPSSGPGAPAAAAASNNAKKQMFTFDQVHPPATTQYAMFTSTAQPLISRFVEGFNCTILAYGQTSSGKTFTMTGIDLDADPSDPSNGMGIIPRAVSNIFTRCKELKQERGAAWNFSIKGSFIEIYNEDLIDLLVDDTLGRREVQIREDKQGHILWEGLREVNVKTAHDVMKLIKQGASIRRTNETDMNAQSSRSHAIFSLTLTQKKFTGGGQPPRSSSPLPPGGRSPSRLARPGSVFGAPSGARVSSPTFGRSATPTSSFHSAIGRGGRPASSLGLLSPHGTKQGDDDDDRGEWVTVVSKFHFVDLAGSERLKRTAAAGERIKEGISINSGLLALGNVISALGDPGKAKTNTATYIPYRDSKLTRLLQDSLGGNSHTLMIACISPAEWNANETVNTLKYANRARNIKNRATINEKEDGWDDVEWLQGMVTRLRKELKGIKDGGSIPTGPNSLGHSDVTETPKKVLAQMSELQNNYEDLREKFVERTEELTRLRNELSDKQRNSGGRLPGTARYEEIVGPVIEEYEKTIGAMEAELKLNRAALRHTNDLYDEKEHEYDALAERHSTTEMYLEELKARVAKMAERESSTEAYVHDLEEKIKQYDETSMSSSGSITDLKRELAKYKDSESQSTGYIAALEARLGKSEESVLTLRQSVEELEHECERRSQQVETLQSRLESLKQDGESWRSDLEKREQKVRELEAKISEWEAKRAAANEDRERLGGLVNEVAKAKKELEGASPVSVSPASANGSSVNLATPNTTNGTTLTNGLLNGSSQVSLVRPDGGDLEHQLFSLQETHTATLADLSAVTVKYRDALREIADLAAQLQEAKVTAPMPPPPRDDSPERSAELSPKRRMYRTKSREASDTSQNSTGRRHFFRSAASADSLHSRSPSQSVSQSLSLSQELTSARSRDGSISSRGTTSPGGSPQISRPNLSISLPYVAVSPAERSVLSMEEEIMRLQEVLKEREAEISVLEATLKEKDTAPQTPSPKTNGKQAEPNGDAHLYLSPKTMSKFSEIRKSLDMRDVNAFTVSDVDESLERLNELMRSMAQKESSHKQVVDDLTEELAQVRKQHEELQVLSRDQAVNMSQELEALRNKHNEDLATHHGSLFQELQTLQAREEETRMTLQDVQKREEELVDQLKRAAEEHDEAVQKLRADHEEAMRTKEAEIDTLLSTLRNDHDSSVKALHAQLAESSAALEKAHQDHEEMFGKLNEGHAEELRRRVDEANALLEQTKSELEGRLDAATTSHDEAVNRLRSEHAEALDRVKTEHEEVLRRRTEEAAEALEQTKAEHQEAITKLNEAHQATIASLEQANAANLQRTEEEYYEALTKLRSDHALTLEKQAAESATALQRLKEDHVRELRMAEIAREGSLSESESSRESAMKDLQDAHSSAMKVKEQEFADDVQRLKDEHAQALAAKLEQHRESVQRLKADHATTLASKEAAFEQQLETAEAEHSKALTAKDHELQLALEKLTQEHATVLAQSQQESAKEVAQLKQALEESQVARTTSEASLRKEMDEAVQSVRKKQAAVLEEVERGHADELARLQESHAAALSSSENGLEEARTALLKSHTEELTKLKAEHQSAIAAVEATVIALQEQHRSELEEAHSHSQRTLAEQKEHLEAALADQEKRHAEEREVLLKDHAVLAEKAEAAHREELTKLAKVHGDLADELQAYKATSDEFAHHREEMRRSHEAAMQQKLQAITGLQTELSAAKTERSELATEVERLRAELKNTREETASLVKEASKRKSLVDELEKHRSVLAETQEKLQRTKDEMDTLQAEKMRQDALLKELQSQLQSPSSAAPVIQTPQRPSVMDRNVSYTRATGMSPGKLPPPTPPPNVPIPPAPRSMHEQTSSSSSAGLSSRSFSGESDTPTTPATSVAHSLANGAPPSPLAMREPDAKLMTQVQAQAKQIDEQEAMIKTLNKQLTHCEGDLQAHMDMVATLESSLGDSEKNLRKARMQATELARERDNLTSQITTLRAELQEAKNEVVNVRRSIVEEKQSLESRLDEERRAKERARAQLDSRMDELQRRKNKFACL